MLIFKNVENSRDAWTIAHFGTAEKKNFGSRTQKSGVFFSKKFSLKKKNLLNIFDVGG